MVRGSVDNSDKQLQASFTLHLRKERVLVSPLARAAKRRKTIIILLANRPKISLSVCGQGLLPQNSTGHFFRFHSSDSRR